MVYGRFVFTISMYPHQTHGGLYRMVELRSSTLSIGKKNLITITTNVVKNLLLVRAI